MKTLSAFARKLAPIIVGAFALLTSCLFDDEVIPVPPPAPEGMAEVSFMAEMPAPTVVTTRAVGSVPENKVEDIYVLVFETGTDGELVYKGKGKNLAVATGATNGNRITFKATLPVGETYDFMVLANAEAALAAINVSDAPARKRSDVLALTRTLAAGAKWNVSSSAMTPIPMWGELKNRTLAASDAVTFPLTRMLARVNVEYNPANTAVPTNFRLTSVRVYNYNKSGALVPAAASLETDGITAKNATEPHGGYATQTGGALVYEGTDITDSKLCANMIYLFEAAHNGSTYKLPAGNSDWIDNPCLVVGGRYSADGTNWPASDTYYRVDFIRKTGGATPAEEWLSLMRNFSYNVTITEVSGEGYDDPETALRSAPFNMEANILPWNERNMEKVVFDGVFYLSVSQDEFVFQRRGTEDAEDGYNTLKIKTDFLYNSDPADAKSGWRVDRIVKAGTDEPLEGDWLHLMPEVRPTGWSPDDVDDAFFTFKDNDTNANREADVWIKAGRLEYKIHVVQKILSLDLLDGSSDDPIEEVTFVIPHTGSTGTESKQFRVEWTPSGQPVAISGISPVDYNPFEPGWITGGTAFPEPGLTSLIPAQPSEAVGTETYTVTPPAVTAAKLATDPFYEKATEYTFSIENLGETIEKSIMLHNIHYALVVDVNKYRLDGGTHTVTARSNTDWVITDVEEWLYNVDPKTLPAGQRPTAPVMLQLKTYDNLKTGTTGGPNINGDALAFTVVDNEGGQHDGKWGTVYVTFESPTGKFPKQTVALQFPPATRLIMGLGYQDVYSVNPGMPAREHHNSVFQMLTSPYNFGSMAESVYKVEGLRVIGYNTQGDKNPTVPTPTGALYPDRDWHVNSMIGWLNDDRPDVIFIGDFDSDGPSTHWTENEIQLLDQYVDNGGALILMYNGAVGYTSRLVRFLEVLLDKSQALTVSTGGNTVDTDVKTWTDIPASGAWYTLNGTNGAGETDPLYNDPILNGPFGDVRGKYWGAHYHTAGIQTSLLGSDIIPLSNAKAAALSGGRGNEGYTTIFRHKTKNILFIGAGGFGATNMTQWQLGTYPQYGPVALEQNFYRPIARTNWGLVGSSLANRVEVYNSVLLGNAVAWALTVTNHMPPAAPGYQNIP